MRADTTETEISYERRQCKHVTFFIKDSDFNKHNVYSDVVKERANGKDTQLYRVTRITQTTYTEPSITSELEIDHQYTTITTVKERIL